MSSTPAATSWRARLAPRRGPGKRGVGLAADARLGHPLAGFGRRAGRFAIDRRCRRISTTCRNTSGTRSPPAPGVCRRRFGRARRENGPRCRPLPGSPSKPLIWLDRRGKELNLLPLPCVGSALPMSYAPLSVQAIPLPRLQLSSHGPPTCFSCQCRPRPRARPR